MFILGHVEGRLLLHWCDTLPRLLCATASRSEGTCSGSGVSSALHLQICTAKAPWELQKEREDKITLGGRHRMTPRKDRSPFEPCCTSLLLPRLLSPPFSLPSYGAPRQIPRPTMLAGPPFPRPRLAAHERALQGIVEIIITVIALVNTSEMVMQGRSVSQSLFLEGVPVPDELSLRVLLSQPFSLLFEILCLFPIHSHQVQVPRCAVV